MQLGTARPDHGPRRTTLHGRERMDPRRLHPTGATRHRRDRPDRGRPVNDAEFQAAKRAALVRQGHHCQRCGRNVHDPALWPGRSGHHRQLRRTADPQVRHSPENIIVLCGSGTTGCHGWIHVHVAEARRNGWIVPVGSEPASTPVRDWTGRWQLLLPDGTARTLTPGELIAIRTKEEPQ
nr:MAG TPA: NinG protein [Caudoviricetes sp.]